MFIKAVTVSLFLMIASIYADQLYEKTGLSKINPSVWGCCNLASFSQPMETYGDYQYTVFYDGSGHVCVARRFVLDSIWDTLRISGYITTTSDGHNTPAIGLSPQDGTIHIAFDHHNDPLHYSVSVKGVLFRPDTIEWNGSLFGPVRNSAVMPTLNVVTYPHFLVRPDGVLQFITRLNGGSGFADWALWEYKADSSKWSSIGIILSQQGTFIWPDGYVDNDRCAYPNGYTYHNNRLHISWCWREDCCRQNANHDLLYAYSDDFGRTWRNSSGDSAGATATNPLKLNSPGIKVWDIPVNKGYINQVAQNVDSKGRIHVITWHVGGDGSDQGYLPVNASYFHYWRDTTGIWHRDSIFKRQERCKFIFDDQDNILMVTSPGKVYVASAANLWIDWNQVMNESIGDGEPTVDFSRWKNSRIISQLSSSLNVLDYNVNPSDWPFVKIKVHKKTDSTLIEGAVAALYTGHNLIRGKITNNYGVSLFCIKPGKYSAVVKMAGFESIRLENISVSSNPAETLSLNIYLVSQRVVGLNINPDTLSLIISDSSLLSPRLVYSDNKVGLCNDPIVWISRSSHIAEIDSRGMVKSLGAEGKTWIIGAIRNGEFTDSVYVTIISVRQIAPIADAYVRDGTYASDNYGSEATLVTKIGVAGYTRRSYLKFDLSSLADIDILSAKLSLTLTLTDQAYSMPVTVCHVADNTWLESAITWNNKPVLGMPIDTIDIGSATGIYEWDITQWVKVHKNETLASLCLMEGAIADKVAHFASKEAGQNAPKIIVRFNSGTTYLNQRVTEVLNENLSVSPNPFNPSTSIAFMVDSKQHVQIDVLNASGQKIETITKGHFSKGRHEVIWSMKDNPSGVYFFRMVAGKKEIMKKVVACK